MKNNLRHAEQLAKDLKISKGRALEAVLKAKLIAAIIAESNRSKLTHAEIAKLADIPRSAVTGIFTGSLQKVTLDRILRLVEAVGLTADLKITRVA